MVKSAIQRRLGTEVRERRKRRDLSQEKLAFRANVAMQTVAKLEQGNANITLLKLWRIAGALNTTLSELFVGAEQRR